MREPSSQDLAKLTDHIRNVLPREEWIDWPGGWPGQIDAALLDAVFSIRARYGNESSGVRAVVRRWKDHVGSEKPDDLSRLGAFSDRSHELEGILGNHQRLSSGASKASGVARAAARLVDMGVHHADDINADAVEQERAYVGVHGLGKVTWVYFLMLLGKPGVKADVMVQRFVEDALGNERSAEFCRSLVERAANDLGVESTKLDHAIWAYQRRKPARE